MTAELLNVVQGARQDDGQHVGSLSDMTYSTVDLTLHKEGVDLPGQSCTLRGHPIFRRRTGS